MPISLKAIFKPDIILAFLTGLVFAFIEIVPVTLIDWPIKILILVVIGQVIGIISILYYMTRDLETRKHKLDSEEERIKAEEERIKAEEERIKAENLNIYLPREIHWTAFGRSEHVNPTDGTSTVTMKLQAKNVGTIPRRHILIPKKRSDIYTNDVEGKRVQDFEKIISCKVNGKAIPKTRFDGMYYKPKFVLESVASALRFSHETGSLAHTEVIYQIPIDGPLPPGGTVDIELVTESKNMYAKLAEHEQVGLAIYEPRESIAICLRTEASHTIALVTDAEEYPTGVEVINLGYGVGDHPERDRLPVPEIEPDGRELSWSCTQPKIGFIYIVHFRLVAG